MKNEDAKKAVTNIGSNMLTRLKTQTESMMKAKEQKSLDLSLISEDEQIDEQDEHGKQDEQDRNRTPDKLMSSA